MYKAEDINTEFKREFSDTIKKTAVAFANTNGGRIYIGIDDNGVAVGVADLDMTLRQVSDSVRNSIKPDITRFMQVSSETENGKPIVVLTIERGTSIPYYLADHGLKPSGVFVRVGSMSAPASEEHIRQMIKDADGERYVTARSLNQSLTFIRAQTEFDDRGVAFGEPQKRTLGVINESGLYTNLGLLFSEQCEHSVKVAVFEGITKAVFKSRKEISGSIIHQIYETIEYLDYFNHIHAEIGKVRRTETRDYPVGSIRESVVNALTHREYGLSASTFINVYDNRIEFLSVGGLVPGITLDAVLSGVSHSRNEALADVFYRLEIVEAFGTGIMRIMADYADSPIKPELNITDSSFMITLPNMRASNSVTKTAGNGQERKTMELIMRDGYITTDSLAAELNLGKSRCYGILRGMVEAGKVKEVRNGRKIEYHAL